MKYNIAFIDDEDKNIRKFKIIAEDDSDFNIVDIPFDEDINNFITNLASANLHAILIDFKLNRAKVRYTGSDLIDILDKMLPGFPTFLLTSYESDGEDNVYDVNKVYRKDDYFEGGDKAESFHKKIKKQIEHYLSLVKDNENELKALVQKAQRGGLNLEEEERLVELDDFIEKSSLSNYKTPRDLKKVTNQDRLQELIAKANDIIQRIEEE